MTALLLAGWVAANALAVVLPRQRTEKSHETGCREQLPGREDLERRERSVRPFVGERPLTAVLLALTTGYVVGRVLTRFR